MDKTRKKIFATFPNSPSHAQIETQHLNPKLNPESRDVAQL